MFLETLSPEDQSDKGQSQAFQRVVRKRSERFYEITYRTPGRGLVLLCKSFTTRLTGGCQYDVFSLCACFNLNLSYFSSYFAPQLRSYSRHDLMVDPFEDNVSEVKFRKQRVAMERRVSSTGCDNHLKCST